MVMRRLGHFLALAILLVASPVSAEPTFVNSLVIGGGTLDDTREPGANAGRFGSFSDIYYDPGAKNSGPCPTAGPAGAFSTTPRGSIASISMFIRSPAA